MNKLYPIKQWKTNDDDLENPFKNEYYVYHVNVDERELLFKIKSDGNALLSEVVTAQICKSLDAPVAEQTLGICKTKLMAYRGVLSTDFTNGDKIETLPEFFKIRFTNNLSAWNLEEFIKTYMSGIDPKFKGQFVDHWLVDNFIGNWDNHNGQNASVRIKPDRTIEMAPHYDGEKTIFFHTPCSVLVAARYNDLAAGITPQNAEFLKRRYTPQVTRFKDNLATLKTNPRLADICNVTGLEEMYNIPVEHNKLEKLSAHVFDGYKKRIDLFVQAI
jgi:hypothetical protein